MWTNVVMRLETTKLSVCLAVFLLVSGWLSVCLSLSDRMSIPIWMADCLWLSVLLTPIIYFIYVIIHYLAMSGL